MVSKFKNVATVIVSLQIVYHAFADDYSNEFNTDASQQNYQTSNFEGNFIEDQVENLKLSADDSKSDYLNDDDCWLKLNAKEHFKIMDNLDAKYSDVKKDYQNSVNDAMDKEMLDDLLRNKGKAHSAVYGAGGDPNKIPAGLNLGGYCMMRLKDSILFFHRMKLRNSTHFQVKYLHNDLDNMALIARLGLNDLHLMGSYERSATHKDPSILYYRPTFGQIELLLKNVDYKMEGRLRLVSDRFIIELVNSELIVNDDILMTYRNIDETDDRITLKLQKENIDDYLQRLKTDLDMWLKDYFNDFLMYYPLPDADHSEFQEYNKQKTIALNDYVDNAVKAIRQRIFHLGGFALKLPRFTIYSVPNMILKITRGVLRGMDTMYRKSVGTGGKNKDIRLVDVLVGFSQLRVEYKFEAVLPNGSPALSGRLLLTQDGMTAHLGISLVKEPESVDLNFEFVQQVKPESLTVEGPASKLIANYKHQVENQILAIMSNALLHNIKMMNTITRCVPFIYAYTDEDPLLINDNFHMKKKSQGQREKNFHFKKVRLNNLIKT